jgi:hypothetical protein
MVDQAGLRALLPKHITRVGVMILLGDIQDVGAGASHINQTDEKRTSLLEGQIAVRLTLRRVLGCRVNWTTSEISRPWHMWALLGAADTFNEQLRPLRKLSIHAFRLTW